MPAFNVVVDAMALLFGETQAVQILRGVEADYDAVAAERDALENRATALEAALARSQSEAAALVNMITQVREDAADGVLDNPIPDPVPAPEPEPVPAPVEPTPVV
jgi:hypothetical protein